VNETACPTLGDEGLKAKLAARGGGGGLVTAIDLWDVMVCCGDPLSLTVMTTLKVPGDE